MIRRCDGNDPNLWDENGDPCACGRVFDDVDRATIYPHDPAGGGGMGDFLAAAWGIARHPGRDDRARVTALDDLRAECAKSGLICPSCETNWADTKRGHQIQVHTASREPETATLKCQDGTLKTIAVAGAFAIFSTAANISLLDQYRNGVDAVMPG